MALLGKKDIKELAVEAPKPKEAIIKTPEVAPASVPEAAPAKTETIGPPAGERAEAVPAATEAAPSSVPSKSVAVPEVSLEVKDEVVQEIEQILSEDLTDLFLKMSPEQQEAFREKGEETASKIREILASTKINIRKVVSLITDWLKMIPGVNKFFLEKEAKIKTDQILQSADNFRQEGKL